ncbi:MAG: C39 family peptidase [Ardenticatenaceae bacterium]|nr:C39 family peptidase [Anaerolineales bacterium]MCB8920527.1 C39 family peptidase [Ardenticatenaceae bacterium]MCB8989470.1 C39 family peptidase [Ardenticatenaceae bacterium]MCB9004992.1 C39 family peptidase [Ardenticatenaceae bacterium]
MKKRGLLLLLPMVLLVGLIFSVPAILRATPSRYVARLPEPLQKLGAPREQAPLLPTAAPPVNAAALLAPTPTSTASPLVEPVTFTPVPTITPGGESEPPTSTPTPIPSPTLPPTATPVPIPAEARLTGITHKFQTWNNCGPATLAMTLSYFGEYFTQDQTAAVLKPNPEDRNVSPWEMTAFVNEQTDLQALFRVNGTRYTVQRLLANGIPVIVEIGIDPPGEYRWLGWYGHYLLLVAYDDAAEQFWVYDSWFGTSEEPLANANADGRILTYDEFETYWPHFNRNYIVLYEPQQAAPVADIIGNDMDDAVMWEHALQHVQTETAVTPDNAFNWFNLGTIYNALGQYANAATAFDQARAVGLPWRMLWYQFGPYEAYYENGRYEDIILLADTTLKDRPYFEESYYYKGLALAALGDDDAARENLQKAADFNPNFAPAAAALAELGE